MADTLTIDLPQHLHQRLTERARHAGLAPEELASRLLAESVQQQEFPRITFEDAAGGGRKARVAGSLQVWGIILNARGFDMDAARTAEYLAISQEDVEVALAYYAAYPEEIDRRLEDLDRPVEEFLREHPQVEVFEATGKRDASAA